MPFCCLEYENSHRHTYRQTDRQNDYSNPRCACAPRVNKSSNKATRIVRGTIVEKNDKNCTYKICYSLFDRQVEEWFHTSDITSLTLEEEIRNMFQKENVIFQGVQLRKHTILTWHMKMTRAPHHLMDHTYLQL